MNSTDFAKIFDRMQLIWLQEIRKDDTIKLLAREYHVIWSGVPYEIVDEAITLAMNAGIVTYGRLPEVGQINPFIQGIYQRMRENKGDHTYLPNFDPKLAKLNCLFWQLIFSCLAAKQSGKPVYFNDQIRCIQAFSRMILEYRNLANVQYCPKEEILIEAIYNANNTLGNAVKKHLNLNK